MKTWLHVQRRLERMRLPYRVQDETLVTLDGTPVAVTVQGARDFLSSPGHPDSKRQQRCKQRSLTRHGARVLKQSGQVTSPVAMARAGGKCERCKKRKPVHVHHILPVRYFADPADAHFLDNTLAVCLRCHQEEHRQLKHRFPLFNRLPYKFKN